MSTQALFIVSNLVGGGEVLESYYWGLASFPEYREALSGGVHGSLRTILTISMIFAALGYLLFCYVTLFGDGLVHFNNANRLGIHTVEIMAVIFLASAALWMPSAIYYLKTQDSIWWIVSITVLSITPLALLTLIYIAVSTSGDSIGPGTKYLAVAGLTSILVFVTSTSHIYIQRNDQMHRI